jgi:hypothetical protein
MRKAIIVVLPRSSKRQLNSLFLRNNSLILSIFPFNLRRGLLEASELRGRTDFGELSAVCFASKPRCSRSTAGA